MGGHDDGDVDEATASYEYLLKMKATNEQMERARVPLAWRDQCAHKLIPLNKCRQQNFYLPWRCVELRHSYEKCEYYLLLARMWQMQQQENVAPAPLPAQTLPSKGGILHA